MTNTQIKATLPDVCPKCDSVGEVHWRSKGKFASVECWGCEARGYWESGSWEWVDESMVSAMNAIQDDAEGDL